MIEKALAYHERFLDERGDRPELAEDAATAHFHRALLLREFDRFEAAQESLAWARSARERLRSGADGADAVAYQDLEIARIQSLEVALLVDTPERAVELADRVLRVLTPRSDADAVELRVQTLQRLASAQNAAGRVDDAVSSLQEARRQEDVLRGLDPSRVEPAQTASISVSLGRMFVQLHRFDEAFEILEQALEQVELAPPTYVTQSLKAHAQRLLGICFRTRGQVEDALQITQTAASSFRQLTIENPKTPVYFSFLCDVENAIANTLSGRDVEAARVHYLAAMTSAEAILGLEPTSENGSYQLALAHYGIGLLDRLRDPALALESFDRALENLPARVQSGQALELRSRAQHNSCVMLRRLGREDEAIQLLESSIQGKRALVAAQPDRPVRSKDLAVGLRYLGKVHAANGRSDDADRAYAESQGLMVDLVEKHPDVLAYGQTLLLVLTSRAVAVRKQPELACEHLEVGARWMSSLPRERAARYASSPGFVTTAVRTWMNLAVAREQSGDVLGACDALEHLIDLDPEHEPAHQYLDTLEKKKPSGRDG